MVLTEEEQWNYNWQKSTFLIHDIEAVKKFSLYEPHALFVEVELDDAKLADLLELKYKALADAKRELVTIKTIRESFIGFQETLYTA